MERRVALSGGLALELSLSSLASGCVGGGATAHRSCRAQAAAVMAIWCYAAQNAGFEAPGSKAGARGHRLHGPPEALSHAACGLALKD